MYKKFMILERNYMMEITRCYGDNCQSVWHGDCAIRNFTPHDINIILDGETITIPSEGIARVEEEKVDCPLINGKIPSYQIKYGRVQGLPELKIGEILVVSVLVAQALKQNHCEEGIYYPGDFARDEQGKIIGCKSLYKL
jgi:hypothetical protein